MNANRKTLILIAGAVGVLGLVIVLFVMMRSGFRLVEASPRGDTFSTAEVRFVFSESLDKRTLTEFSISPSIEGDVTIDDTDVIFKPRSSYQLEKEYTASLRSVFSKSGKKIGRTSVTFTAKHIDQQNLSKEQSEELEQTTNSVERTNPFIAKLPHSTIDYKVSYELQPSVRGKSQVILKVELYPITNGNNQDESYQAQLMRLYKKAMKWITDNGGGSDYPIVTTPDIEDFGYTGDGNEPVQPEKN